MSDIAAPIIAGTALVALGGFGAWVQWTLKRVVQDAVRETVNGKIDRQAETLDRTAADVRSLTRWASKHDDRHKVERGALIVSMHRQGLQAPDGWAE